MEFKGTKGEWSYEIDYCDKFKQAVLNIGSSMDVNFAAVYTGQSEVDTISESNAKLIVSSPKLLEALQSLIDPLTGLVLASVANYIGKEKAYYIEQAIEKALK